MIALLLALVATMSGAGAHAAAQRVQPAAISGAASKPIVNPLTGHPLAG
jgi:hypothetical protein